VIRERGGAIDKHIGETVMAVWGVDAAREDDPEQAVHAALALREALSKFIKNRRGLPVRDDGEPALQLRIGINTGPVLLGEVGTQGEITAMGDTVNVASRLQHAAKTDQVIISIDTYRHVRGVFDVVEQEPITVKGKSEPVHTYQVITVKPRAFRIGTRGVEGVETHMVGRDSELKLLQDNFTEVSNGGDARVITIVGDAGIGKSRLLHEYNKWMEVNPQMVWHFKGRVSEHSLHEPFALWRDLLAFRFEIQETDSAAVVRQKIEAQVAELLTDKSEEKAHFIGHLVGFDFSNSPHLAGVFADAAQMRARAFHYLAQYFRAMHESDGDPIQFFLEDIHWADDGSLELIDSLATECEDVPILFVCLARPLLYERHPEWGHEKEHHTRVALEPLARTDSVRLVDDILQKVSKVPVVLRELIVTRSEGNPYYVEELVKMLIDDGVIVKHEDRWRVEADRLVVAKVPPTLTGVIQARLDGLPAMEKAVLQRAAVVGRVFWDKAVEALVDERPLELASLPGLATRELVFEREASAFAGATEYIFKHAVLHEVTYESVLKRLRRSYHAQAAAWLEQQRGERLGEHIAMIAEHYERAEDAGKALEYLNRAGENAMLRSAYREAIGFFDRALTLASGDFAATLLNARQWQTLLQNQIGKCYLNLGEVDMARQWNEKSLTNAREIGNSESIARALQNLGTIAYGIGDVAEARKHTSEALRLYRDIDDLPGMVDALGILGDIAFSESQYDEASKLFEEAIDLASELDDRPRLAGIMTSYALVPWGRGDAAGALPLLEKCRAMLTEIGDRTRLANTLNSLGGVAYLTGDYERARASYLESLRLCEEIGDRNGLGRVLGNLGELAHDTGNAEESRAYIQRSLRENKAIGSMPRILYGLYTVARQLAASGDQTGAAELMGLALNHPATRADLRLSSEQFVKDLQSQVGQQEYDSASERGKLLNLEQVLDTILGHEEPKKKPARKTA
jgi:tetratricopeptide (TPR) repeat protein